MTTEYKACIFDAYGTLFDVHSAARTVANELDGKWEQISALWRQKQLEYTWLYSLMGDYKSFWEITKDALDFTLEQLNCTVAPTVKQNILDVYLKLETYNEVKPVLTALHDMNITTAILSNGSPDMLYSAVQNAGIAEMLNASLSVDDLQIFKPDQRVYEIARSYCDLEPNQIMFVSSNGWDIAGASRFGFDCAWINRSKQAAERLPHKPKIILNDLSTLPEIINNRIL